MISFQKKVNNKHNQRKGGAVLSYVHLFLATVINLLYVPILLKALGENEYGVYQLIASMVSYLAILQSTLSSTTIRFYSKSLAEGNKQESNRILFTSKKIFQLISSIIIILGVIIYFLITPFYRGALSELELVHAKQVFVILLSQICFEVSGCLYNAIIHSHERFVFIKILSICTTVANPIVLLLVISKFPYAITVAIVHLCLSILFFCLKREYSRNVLGVKIRRCRFEKILLSQMLAFSGGLILAIIADHLFWKTDQIILTKICGASVVAVYSIGATIYMNYISLSSAINNVFLPRITELVVNNRNEEINQLFLRIGRYQFIILSLVLSGFLLFGNDFIILWVGNGYSEVYWIVVLIIVPLAPDLCEGIGLSVLQARNTYTFRAYLYFGMAIINIVATVFFSKLYSGIGAALATGLSIIIGSLIGLNLYYSKKEKLPISSLFLMFIKSSVIFTLLIPLGLLENHFIPANSFLMLSGKIIIYTFLYCICVYVFLLSEEERKIIISVLKRNWKKVIL